MKRSAKIGALILAGLMLALATALATALAGCTAQPGKPSGDMQSSLIPGLYTVDTKPEGPMLYPVMSKAIPDNPFNIPDYPIYGYAANSFKLVNEHWEDVTGYINGEYEYVRVNGEVFGIQIREYKDEKRYILGLDGKPIEALKGYVWRNAWEQRSGMPADMMFVTTEALYKEAAAVEWGMWPLVGAFNTRSGELIIPVEYESLILLEDIALGFKDGVMSVLDYDGNVLSTQGEDWQPSNEGYYEGDDLLLVNDTTYIDRKGEIALTLEGVRGQSNFGGDYAYGVLGEPGEPWEEIVFIDRQGQTKRLHSEVSIQRWENCFIVDSKEMLDFSLQPVFTLTNEHETFVDLIGGTVITSTWNPEAEASVTTAYDKQTGDKKFSVDASVWHENGFLIEWGDESFRSVYGMDGKAIFENARILKISGDGKFIYIDDGKRMGYIDLQGEWVYRMPAAYYNLED